MARINLTASSYRVARGKAEIARDAKWLKKAKLTTKKGRELRKPEPSGKGIDGSGGQDQNITPGAEDREGLDKSKANEPTGHEAPDNKKER